MYIMKKLFAVLVSLSLISAMTTSSMAKSTTIMSQEVQGNNIKVIDQAFLDKLVQNETDTLSMESTSPGITFQYSFTEIDTNRAKAEVNASVEYAGIEFPICASGYVDKYVLSTGILWEGALDGTATIGNENYDAIIAFAKLDNSPDVQLSATISGNEDIPGSCYLLFGSDLITFSMQEELFQNAQNNEKVSDYNTASNISTSKVAQPVTTAYGSFKTSPTIRRGQTAKAYFDKGSIISISLGSDCEKLEEHFKESGIQPTSYVDTAHIELICDDSDARYHSWIVGMLQFDDYGADPKTILIKPLLEDICSVAGIPTSVLDSIFSTLKGSVTARYNTNVSSVTFEFGRDDKANFDTGGAVVAFQMDRNNTGYTGPSGYTMHTELRYVTHLADIDAHTIRYVYTNTTDVNAVFALTLA